MIAYERPRALWHVVALGAVITVCATAAWTGHSALAGPRPEEDAANAAAGRDIERQGISIGRTHEIGLAMTSWLADVSTAGAGTSAGAEPASEAAAWPGAGHGAGDGAAGDQPGDAGPEQAAASVPQPSGPAADPDPTTADWSACPPIPYDELAALLAGTYAGELPRTDGWGHPFEYCLDRRRAGTSRYTVGVRSPGRDGRWQGETYPAGGFASDELDGDLLWIDGFFVTWPRPR